MLPLCREKTQNMAIPTLTEKIYVTNSKGLHEVKLILCHKRLRRRIDTNILVRDGQIRKRRGMKEYEIIDSVVQDKVNSLLKKYNSKLNDLSENIPFMDVDELKDRLVTETVNRSLPINFIEFCFNYSEELKANGRGSTARKTMMPVVNNLIDFIGGNIEDGKKNILYSSEITYDFLLRFERFMRSERKQRRLRQGEYRTVTRKAATDYGVHNTFRDLRVMFYEARKRSYDESTGQYGIQNNPFPIYDIVDAPERIKHSARIDIVLRIAYALCKKGSRQELARDMCLLSFYLCGMNMVDFYNTDCDFYSRAEYNRSKTKDRRKDKAYISVNIPELAQPLVDKWRGKLQKRYANADVFNVAVEQGLKQLVKGITPYDFRRYVGDAARNICGFSKDDVALALNHYDQSVSSTDPYISNDWKIVDSVQEGLLSLLSSNLAI